jgi:hypothetical protein
MTIAAGTKLGSYEVVTQIGAGGMDEVYRARAGAYRTYQDPPRFARPSR